MNTYAKIILYTYPLLTTVEKDYEDHIKNRALLSYKNGRLAEEAVEEIAKEILEKRNLAWLKCLAEEVFVRLDDVEKLLVKIRYFGQARKIKYFLTLDLVGQGKKESRERAYFRRQQKLAEKIAGIFTEKGLTKEVFERDFSKIPIFDKARRILCKGCAKKLQKEREILLSAL